MNRKHAVAAAGMLAALGLTLCAQAQQARDNSIIREIERYRETLGDDNPAELWAARGEELWKQKRGPNNVSLEKCDLGLGPGVVKGVYTVLPKYFPDSDKVEDLESRLVTCMVKLQGISPEEAKARPFGNPYEGTVEKVPMDALVAYIVTQSHGMKMNVAGTHPKEREAYKLGRRIFFYRAGTHDFACASCHKEDGKRIRLQDLPNLTTDAAIQRSYPAWPAYRVSQGNFRSFQWRLWECLRQARYPELEFVSPASIALTTYLAERAKGGVVTAPTIKR